MLVYQGIYTNIHWTNINKHIIYKHIQQDGAAARVFVRVHYAEPQSQCFSAFWDVGGMAKWLTRLKFPKHKTRNVRCYNSYTIGIL